MKMYWSSWLSNWRASKFWPGRSSRMFPRDPLASRTPTEESMKGRKTKGGLAVKGLARDTQGRLYRPWPKEPTIPKVPHKPGTSQRLSSWMAWLCSRAKFVDLTDSCSHNKLFPQGFPKNPSKSLTPLAVNKGGSRCGLKAKCESCSSYRSYCTCVYDFAVKNATVSARLGTGDILLQQSWLWWCADHQALLRS